MADDKPPMAVAVAVATPAIATAVATPAVATATPVMATATATPVIAQAAAVAVPMQASPVGHSPTGAWKSGLFSCCDDCCTCMAAWFCGFVVVPQLTERMSGRSGKCKKLTIVLVVLWLIYYGLSVGNQVWSALSWGDDDDLEEDLEEERDERSFRFGGGTPLGMPSQIASILFWGTLIHLTIQVRRAIRARDNIHEDGCSECCTVVFCDPCVVSQMLRQLDIDGSNYQLCSATGDGSASGPARV